MRVGTNECTLKRGFKTVFGTTVFGHIFDYRMEIACRYLLDSSKTIQEIGACVGYEYHAHFSTAFKRKFGLTLWNTGATVWAPPEVTTGLPSDGINGKSV
nr:AraC family transcriptional regulator [Bacteroides fragilis]